MLLSSSCLFAASPPPKPPQRRPITTRHVIPASSRRRTCSKASAMAGSSAEFPVPEQVMGGGGESPSQQRRRRRTVAGVDQDALVDPSHLADPDSAFFEFNGVRIHHKVCHRQGEEEEAETAAAKIGLPIILLHGFGASVFSWDRLMRPLARLTGSKVLAFDRPAFGLTSRAMMATTASTMPLNPYSMSFSVLATLSFIDSFPAGKAILMGHSAGCLVAVNTYFEAPHKVAALILVAPAIVAPLFLLQKERQRNKSEKESQTEDKELGSSLRGNLFARIWKGVCMLFGFIAGITSQMLKGMKGMLSTAYKNALTTVLRSAFGVMLVRTIMDKFGILAIRNAWYDATQVTDYVIQGYTKPLRAKGWEKALLEYTIAMITDSASKSVQPLTERLGEITCPVLIITGDTDRLIPSWNAKRLSQLISGSKLEIINNCGHLPHEEKVEEFLRVVEAFFQRVFGAQQEKLSQTALAT